MRTLFFVSLLGLSSVACAPATPAFSASGYQSEDYGITVSPLDDDGKVMTDGWKLDNYYYPYEGYDDKGELRLKKSDDFETTYRLDPNGDGEYEDEATEPAYLLRYKHKEHDGVIFVRAVPISADQSEKRLKVLMARYVEQMAGSGYELREVKGDGVVVERRYAAAVSREGAAEIAKHDAYGAQLEVANLDQLKIDENARRTHVEIYLTHTPFEYTSDSFDTYPVLLILGYANQEEEFAEGRVDFVSLLDRFAMEGTAGFKAPAGWEAALEDETETEKADAPSSEEAPTEDAEGEANVADQGESSTADKAADKAAESTADADSSSDD